VIGAFAVASVVSLRSTRHATFDLARMQQQFEPLSHSVHDLGDDLAHGTGDRLDSLLQAAELERADTLEDDLTSPVRMLRRHRR